MSSSNSPCAACKFLRRKCTQECVFAPYFPPENPQKFQDVHKVFGASNVTKILNEIPTSQREDAVNSLAYEAKARINNPVYGCVGYISILRHKLEQLQSDLSNAKKELANYIGPTAMLPMISSQGYLPLQHPGNPSSSMIAYNMHPVMGIPSGASGQLVIREPQQQQQYLQHQQQMFEAQQLAAAVAVREQQEIKWGFEPQQQQELVSFNGVHDVGAITVTATGFNQMSGTGSAVSPSLALRGSFDNLNIQQAQQLELAHPHHHHQLQAQLLLQPQQSQSAQEPHQPEQKHGTEQQRSGSEEGRSVGPSC